MRKPLLLITVAVVAVVAASIFVVSALTASDVVVTVRDLPNTNVAGGQPDILALDFTVQPQRGDRLDAVAITQTGSAQWQTDLVDAKLWADASAAGFQGWYVDRELGRGTWNSSTNGWAFTGLDVEVPESGARFFVTVSTTTSPTNAATVSLRMPGYRDDARPMQYDAGDLGVFLRTARAVPAAPLAGAGMLTLERRVVDSNAPVVRILEPAAGATLERDWMLVRGAARDLGGSSVSRVRLGINRPGRAVTWVDAVPEAAGFATWEARLFGLERGQTYELRVLAEDWVGNRAPESSPTSVTLQ